MRKMLVITIVCLCCFSAIMLLIVFTDSMRPSEKALAMRQQYDISELGKGKYIYKWVGKNRNDTKILIIRDWDSQIYVHMIPFVGKKVPMPDPFWGEGNYRCNDFSPDTDQNNVLSRSGKIRCHDTEAPEWMAKHEWLWEYSGKSAGSWTHDMYSPAYELIVNTIYINRWH